MSQTGKSNILMASFTLINTILGADLLTLPYSFARTGWCFGIILQTLTAIIAGYSFITLAIQAEIVTSIDYQFVVLKILGKVARVYATFSLLIYSFCTMLGFCVVLKDAMFFFSLNDHAYKNIIMWLFLVCIMIPLSLFRDINKLSITSIFAIISVMYLLIYLISVNILITSGKIKIQ